MAITLDGTNGVTTPGVTNTANETVSLGVYAKGAFTGTFTDGVVVDYISTLGRISVGGSDGLAFYNGGVATTELARFDASGNLGLGVTPSAWGSYYKAIQIGTGNGSISNRANGGTWVNYNAYNDNTNWIYGSSGQPAGLYGIINPAGNINHVWYTAPSGTAGNAISFTQAMTLTSGAILCVGWTPDNNCAGVSAKTTTAGQQTFTGWNADTSGTRYYAYFGTGATFTATGSITTTGANCLYNSGSDYRLKDNPKRIKDALTTIAKLNPVTFTWKINGEEDQGFIAHELQEVLPQLVVGEKDAVDDEGLPEYQTVDYSKLTSLLTAAIQELSVKVTALEAK